MKYICDTNFIIRYLLADNQEMFIKTKEIFDKAKIGQVTLIIEQTVFTEVVFVLSSFYQVPKAKIAETLTELLTYKGIDSDIETLLSALDYYQRQNIHIVDCLLLAKSKSTNVPILSFDHKLNAKYDVLQNETEDKQ
jgi:predicted nucleic-acid-binding protein